jgi:hypothetical protein
VQVPAVTDTKPGLPEVVDCGTVQPAGTCSVTCEPELKSLPDGAVNVYVKLLPVLPAVALVGLTVIVPSPSVAIALKVAVTD